MQNIPGKPKLNKSDTTSTDVNPTSTQSSTTKTGNEKKSSKPQMKGRSGNSEVTKKDGRRTYKGREVRQDSEDTSEETSEEKNKPSTTTDAKSSKPLPSSKPTLRSSASGKPEKIPGFNDHPGIKQSH